MHDGEFEERGERFESNTIFERNDLLIFGDFLSLFGIDEHYEEPYNFSDYVKPEYRDRGRTPDGEWA